MQNDKGTVLLSYKMIIRIHREEAISIIHH